MRPQLFDCDKLEFNNNVYDTFFTLVLLHMRNYFLHARVNRRLEQEREM